MKYRVDKADWDGRIWTRGFFFPDGYYRVISLTRRNVKHLEGLEKRGYLLRELEDNDGTLCGLYEEGSDKLVDEESAKDAQYNANLKIKYVTGKALETYKDPAAIVGTPKAERRQMLRSQRMSRAQIEFAREKEKVSKSKSSGLREAAQMMGLSANANLGDIEDHLREQMGS